MTVLFWNLLESCKVNVPTLEVGPTLEIHVCHEDAGVEEIRSAVVDRGLESGPMGERERDMLVQRGLSRQMNEV